MEDNMKVAFISSLHGGVGRVTSDLVSELARYVGHIDLYVYSHSELSIQSSRKFPENVEMKVVTRNPELLMIKLLFSLCRFKGYDIIHIIPSSSILIVGVASKLWNIPIVYTTHGLSNPQDFCFSRFKLYFKIEDFFLKLAAAKSKEFVTMSNNVKNRIKEKYGLEPKVIYHGVNRQYFKFDESKRTEVRKKLNIKQEEFLVLYVGILYRHKDILTLIDAIPKVLRNNGYVKFLIIGRGDQYKEMIEKIKELKMDDYVITKEFVEDISAYYSAADLFVMPSTREEFGLVYIEAMACGLPVIAANAYVAPEVVGDAGLLFEPRNSEDLGNEIIELINNKGLYEKLKEKGLERVKQFTWEKAAEQYYEVYKKVLEGNG